MAFPTGWGRKQTITVSSANIDENLTDFTVLLTRQHFADSAVDPSGANASQANGGDLRFSSDSAGSAPLPYKVIAWEHDTATAADDAGILVAVKVTLSSSSNTVIYAWWDTATADTTTGTSDAFDSNWLAFWPLVSDNVDHVNGEDLDSNVGTVSIGNVAGLEGLSSTSFDGSTQYLTVSSWTTQWFDAPITLSAWCRPDVAVSGYLMGVNALNSRVGIRHHNSSKAAFYHEASDFTSSAAALSAETWGQIVGTESGSSQLVYLNGVSDPSNFFLGGADQDHTSSLSSEASSAPVVGARLFDPLNDAFDGNLCLVEFHKVARSAPWIKANYTQIANPAGFATAGTPESPLSGPPVNTVAPVISKVV